MIPLPINYKITEFKLVGSNCNLLITSAVWSSVLRCTDTVVPMRLLNTRAPMLTLLIQTMSSSNFG